MPGPFARPWKTPLVCIRTKLRHTVEPRSMRVAASTSISVLFTKPRTPLHHPVSDFREPVKFQKLSTQEVQRPS